MKATLIIYIHNNIAMLELVLDSIRLQTERDFEIIFAEDGNDKFVAEFIENYEFRNPVTHVTHDEKGWRKNKVLNDAVKKAKSDWLIFIDGGSVLHPRFVEMHLKYAYKTFFLSGRKVNLTERMTKELIKKKNTILDIPKHVKKNMLSWSKKEKISFAAESVFIEPEGVCKFLLNYRKNDRLLGCNMSFSKKTIYAINGFDEDYEIPMAGENFDLLWRLNAAGYNLYSLRNLAVQYQLYHSFGQVNQYLNQQICKKKKEQNEYICKNGLEKR